MPRLADVDVAVVGAGVAGLGAAATLRAVGVSHLVLEAGARVGGRVHSTPLPWLGETPFEHGAVWLHAAERNPVAAIAEAQGDALTDAASLRRECTMLDGRPATDAELRDYAAAWPRFHAAAEALLEDREDARLCEVARHLPDDPWALSVEAWEGPVIAAADADALSLRDWRDNVLTGSDLLVQGGLGAFVRNRLAQGVAVRLRTPVRTIKWGGPRGGVVLETPAGSVSARACIVTVSTGVLAAGGIAFKPALPAPTQDAIAALPMGAALKVLLEATDADRFGLPPHCSLDRQVRTSGEPFMVFQCWQYGQAAVQGWIGGSAARALEHEGDAAAVDFARSQLRALLGSGVDST
ncbi:MAG: FAD-dependent oxidoreductase, partial [Proteobacteria bacterium]|nr:FAD-dependent oxidoreductase [Pseudomonadota bacterium]